jgi:hypothetical protein
LGESSVTLLGPRIEKLSESFELRGVHSGSGFIVGNDRVIVINVSFKYTFSRDGVVSLAGQGSKFLSPSSDSLVL